jgi:hypothetical protein
MGAPELTFPSDVSDTQGLGLTHQRCEFVPFGETQNAYSLILPKTWKMVDDLGEQVDAVGEAIRIGFFVERTEPGAAGVQVTLTKFPAEIILYDWVQYQADLFGVRLTHCEYVDLPNGPGIDSGGWYGPKDNLHVVRQATFVDEGRIFHLVAMVPAKRYADLMRDFTIAARSFKVDQPTGNRQMEQWLGVTVSASPAFRVGMPISWRARDLGAPLPGKSAVDLLLMHNDQAQVYLRVKAIDPKVAGDATNDELLKTVVEETAEAHVKPTSSWKVEAEMPAGAAPDISGMFMCDAKFEKDDLLELRCGIVRRGPLCFVLTLLSVRRIDNPILWMRARRAYEIALSTVDPLPPSPELN